MWWFIYIKFNVHLEVKWSFPRAQCVCIFENFGIYWNQLKSISLCNLWRFIKRRHKSKNVLKSMEIDFLHASCNINGNRFSQFCIQFGAQNHVYSRHSISNAVLCTSSTLKVILRHFPMPIVYKIESSYKISKNACKWFKLT